MKAVQKKWVRFETNPVLIGFDRSAWFWWCSYKEDQWFTSAHLTGRWSLLSCYMMVKMLDVAKIIKLLIWLKKSCHCYFFIFYKWIKAHNDWHVPSCWCPCCARTIKMGKLSLVDVRILVSCFRKKDGQVFPVRRLTPATGVRCWQ